MIYLALRFHLLKKTRSYEVDNRNRPLTLSCGTAKVNRLSDVTERLIQYTDIIMRFLSYCVEVTRCRLETYADQNPDQIAISEVLGLKETQ